MNHYVRHSRALAFDFGRVLTLDPLSSTFSPILARFGIDPAVFRAAYAEPRHAYDQGVLDGLGYWTLVLRACAPALSAADIHTLVPALSEADFRSWAQPRLDLHRLARKALAADTPMAVVSNMPRGLGDRFTAAWPWLSQIPHRFFSGEFGLIKPDPAFYRHVLDHTGWDPARVLFVDDLSANIAAASRMGFTTLLFTGVPQDLAVIESWLEED